MAQSLLTIPLETFRARVYMVQSSQLVDLIKGIYDLKWTIRDKISDESIHDLERKETICQTELQRRGYLTKQNHNDFRKMKQGQFKRRSF